MFRQVATRGPETHLHIVTECSAQRSSPNAVADRTLYCPAALRVVYSIYREVGEGQYHI